MAYRLGPEERTLDAMQLYWSARDFGRVAINCKKEGCQPLQRDVSGIICAAIFHCQHVHSAICRPRPGSKLRIAVVDYKGVEAACRTLSTPSTTNRDPYPHQPASIRSTMFPAQTMRILQLPNIPQHRHLSIRATDFRTLGRNDPD